VPEWERTVHCIGDVHAGAITDVRLDALRRDVERLGTPASASCRQRGNAASA
jgi:hypothetical protein